jgi:hypothetical protein
MTIYEEPDDFGTQDTDESQMWGSSGRPIACCNFRRYKIWSPYPQYAIKEGRHLNADTYSDDEDDDDFDEGEEELTADDLRALFDSGADLVNFDLNP